ncbi:MAG: DUF4249 domain-containing protein [Bacteroidetes Order II. Incertae sedis bacterium]|nr:DUF4249 domain-containing protein [Bacteroidetes Order II. bacterium]
MQQVLLYMVQLVGLACLIGGSMGCEQFNQPVTLDALPLPKLLIINSIFSPDTFWEVSVTLPKERFEDDTATSYFADATVRIFGNDQLVETLPFVVSCACYRSSSQKPQPGVGYRLEVSASGYPTATAFSQLPQRLTLDQETVVMSHSTERGPQNTVNRRLSALVAMTFTDSPVVGDRYMIAISQETDTASGNHTFPTVVTGYRFKTTSEWLATSGAFNDELSGDEDRRRIAPFLDTGMEGQQIKIPITFSGYTLRYREAQTTDGAKLFTDRMKYRIMIARLSPELYLYERSVIDQRTFSDVPIVEPVPIYSNISDGIGVFAGYAGTSITVQ